jgi:phosphatidylglycerol:prolipoprotein diacylglycerol transferase
MLISIGLSPYAIETPIQVPWYLVFVVISLFCCTFLALGLASRYEVARHHVLLALLPVIIGGLIGARLFHVIDHLDYYAANLQDIPLVWAGGFSQYGMIIGGILSIALYAYQQDLPVARLLDLFSIPLLVGLAIGRVGCIVQGCCYGSPTDLPVAFVYTHPDSLIAPELMGVPLHPTQGYEAISFLALAGVLLGLGKYLQPVKGMTFLLFLIGHSIARFFIFFVRGDYPELTVVAGLTQAQVIAVAVFLISVPWLISCRTKSGRR